MKTCKFLFFVLLFAVLNVCGMAQDGGLLFLKGSLPSTYINPSIPLEKKIQISLAGINTFAGTDGPTIEDITSKNASGKRFIDVINLSQKLNSENSIFGGVDVHTFDVGVRIGATSLIAEHAFKSFVNITYPKYFSAPTTCLQKDILLHLLQSLRYINGNWRLIISSEIPVF